MRIFETVTFNLKSIKFKDNYDYITSLLSQNSLGFGDLGFNFKGVLISTNDKLLKKYPSLKHYTYVKKGSGEVFSSIKTDNENKIISEYVDDSDKDAFLSVLKKIPHTYNYPFMDVILDNIDWYGDGAQKGIRIPTTEGEILHCFDVLHYSNSIKFKKQFDYGNKYNFIILTIERFGDDKELRPLPQAFESIVSAMGKPYSRGLKCIFEQEETILNRQKAKEIKNSIENDINYDRFDDFEHKVEFENRTIDSAIDDITPTSGISPKKAIAAPAKKHGYKYISYGAGEYKYRKLNVNNHSINVTFVIPPFTPFLFVDIDISGYNFNMILPGGDQIKPRTDSVITEYAKIVFEIADEYEALLREKLLEAFGRTPNWYL